MSEKICQFCQGPNIVWSAPNELWNKVMGGEQGIVCPTCFVQKAESAGIIKIWRLVPTDYLAEPRMPDEFQVPVNHVQPKHLEASLKRSLRIVENEFPLQTGIIIFTFDFGPGGGIGYVSNADRAGCIKALEEWIAYQRGLQ